MVTYEEYYNFVKMGLESLKGKIDESIEFTNQQIINLNNTQVSQTQEIKEPEVKETSKPSAKVNTTAKSKTK